MTQNFSQGIEKILVLAKLDSKFREKLFKDRTAALDVSEIELTDSECSILASITDTQLQSAIEQIKGPDQTRRAFIKGGIAAAIATLLIGGGILLTSGFVTTSIGHRIDTPSRLRPASRMAIWIRVISAAQERYKKAFGKYGTLKELGDGNYIDGELASGITEGYVLELFNVTENGWQLKAIPKQEGIASYYSDQTGVIRWSETKEVGPDSEPIDADKEK
jgi:hypothetical protein